MSAATTKKPTAAPAHDRPEFEPIGPGLDALLYGLMIRAEANMTDDDLSAVESNCMAETLVRQLAVLAEGVGCLISADAESNTSGALQTPRDVTDVLFLVANIASVIRGLMNIETHAGLARLRASRKAAGGT